MVGNVVQDAAKDVVVLQLQERWGSVCDTNAGDEDVEVVIVERSILAEGKAGCEEEATKGEQRCQYPALIMAIT